MPDIDFSSAALALCYAKQFDRTQIPKRERMLCLVMCLDQMSVNLVKAVIQKGDKWKNRNRNKIAQMVDARRKQAVQRQELGLFIVGVTLGDIKSVFLFCDCN